MTAQLVHLAGRLTRLLQDPLGFRLLLDAVTLQPADLPTLSRDARLDGAGH